MQLDLSVIDNADIDISVKQSLQKTKTETYNYIKFFPNNFGPLRRLFKQFKQSSMASTGMPGVSEPRPQALVYDTHVAVVK